MDTLEDIQRRLRENQYKNEEHVRLSLVARLLQEYGWNIWDPTEVNTEFVPVPEEDNKRVDVALLVPPSTPVVFIEVKPVGGITNLVQTERQLRDYNRNITATFCIITDGCEWRFYYSLTAGEFGDKCFRTIDLLRDDRDDIKRTFALFLDKNQVRSPDARQRAENLLSLSRTERVLAECLPEARRAVQYPPCPRLPEALRNLAKQHGIEVAVEDAMAFIKKSETQETTRQGETEIIGDRRRTDGPGIPPDKPPDLSHTALTSASIGGQTARNWNDLVAAGLRLAWEQGYTDIAEMQNWSGAHIRPGRHKKNGFHPIRGVNLSLQYVQASRAWEIALKIAAKLRVPITVDFVWHDKPDAAHPGQKGRMHWAP